MSATAVRLSASNVLRLVQPWEGVADGVHQRLARQIEDPSGQREVLWVGCGSGRSVLWWADRFDARVSGVDPDPEAIEQAEAAAGAMGLAHRVTFQTGRPEDLPHEPEVFDLSVVYMLALPRADGDRTLTQAVRVTRRMGTVVAVVPTWLRPPTPADAAHLADLGYAPRLLVEWKAAMRAVGLVELAVDDAALEGRWVGPGGAGLLLRGWRVGRWTGVRAVLSPELRALRQLAGARVLGLSIVRGVRWPHG